MTDPTDPSPAPPSPPPPPVVPGAVHRLRAGERDAHGRAGATLGRRPVRIANALPGELLDVRLDHVGRHVAHGRILAVVEASPDRVHDACPLGATCAGCGLRTTAPDARRAWKHARVRAAMAAAGLGDVPVAPTVASPSEDAWRHKAYLVARRTSEGIALGLFGEGTHRLVRIDGCLAHAPHVERTLDGVRRALALRDPPIYDERSRRGWLRAVSVRGTSDGTATLVTLVVMDRGHDGAHTLGETIRREAPAAVGVVVNVHPEASNAPFGATFLPVVGRSELDERAAGFRLRVSAGSFFQVNPKVGAAIHDAIRAAARNAPPGRAVDLYGGVGATAVRLAADGRAVTLVESPGSAASDARWNLRAYGEATVVAARVEDAIGTLVETGPAAVVVVNPPRSGLSPAVATALAEAGPSLLLYASCDPSTLARDLALLGTKGLRVRGVTPYDLMPQTPHVEALAVVETRA